MLEAKKEILKENIVLNNRKKARFLDAYDKSKRTLFFISVVLSLLIIATTYLLSDASKVFSISVEGNKYLSDETIIKYSGLNEDSIYLFTNTYKTRKNILNADSLITDCKVLKLNDNLIKITVNEKTVVGYGIDDSGDVLFLADGNSQKLDNSNINLIVYVPLIEGFSESDIKLISKNLGELDSELINEISEIHYYPALKYQNVEVIMRDGNYVFTNAYGLNILNKYYDIESSIDMNENRCFYFEDISGNAYTMACPWQGEEVIEENIIEE